METRPPRPADDSAAPSSWSQVPDDGAGLPTIAQVEPAQLVALLSSSRNVILLLGTSSPRSCLPAVARRYGGPGSSTGLAYFNVHGAAEQAWILPLIEPVMPQAHGVRMELRRGYYLFVRGKVAGHHPGLYHPRFDAAMARAERALRAAYTSQTMMAAARRQLDRVNDEAGAMVLEHFDALLGTRAPAVGRAPDPYATLGVAATATASEIRAAYHLRMREYHPDRVSHLDAGAQQAALRRSQEIIQAYQLLK